MWRLCLESEKALLPIKACSHRCGILIQPNPLCLRICVAARICSKSVPIIVEHSSLCFATFKKLSRIIPNVQVGFFMFSLRFLPAVSSQNCCIFLQINNLEVPTPQANLNVFLAKPSKISRLLPVHRSSASVHHHAFSNQNCPSICLCGTFQQIQFVNVSAAFWFHKPRVQLWVHQHEWPHSLRKNSSFPKSCPGGASAWDRLAFFCCDAIMF
jgi:hypothetical protein